MAEKVKSEFGQTDPVDGYDFGEYRYAVAKVARILIRARLLCDPKFRDTFDYSEWSIPPQKPHDSTITVAEIAEGFLKQAKAANSELWRTFIGPNGSGGVAPDDRLWALKIKVNILVDDFELDKAIEHLRKGKKVAWTRVAKWHHLPSIRGWLDRVPAPKNPVGCPVVIVDARTRRLLVNGKAKTLTQSRFNVIQCLLDQYPSKLNKDTLVTSSGHPDALGILKRLCRKDADWKGVIHLAGLTGGGYRIVVPAID